MSNLSAGRERWLAEEPQYQQLLQRIVNLASARIRKQGIFATVSGRTKGMSNLLKKLLKKGYGYEQVTDKAGARIVVRFRHEVESVLRIVEESFEVLKKEDKAESLGYNQVGYSGVHYDVRLKGESVGPGDSEIKDLQCEIQVHTRCQNLWADMDHDLSYKPAQPVPNDLRRDIYLLNAVLEVADRSFSDISSEVANLPGAVGVRLLQELERHFYRFTGERFDPELSVQILENLLHAYEPDEQTRIAALVEEFVQAHEERLKSLFRDYQKSSNPPLLLFQPEGFVLLERLEKNAPVLEEIWTRRYPRDELERLGVAWGKPLD